MEIVISRNIFQAKFNELLGKIKTLKANIDNIIVLNKGYFADHVEQLRICVSSIRKASFKIISNNATLV